MKKNKKILIIGLGLIGGSYAMKLTKQGYEVYAISKRSMLYPCSSLLINTQSSRLGNIMYNIVVWW